MRPMRRKRLDGFGDGRLSTQIQIVPMRVLTDQKRKPNVRKMPQQAFMPKGGTLWPRRIIATRFSDARITKSHWKQSNLRCIEKSFAVDSKPITQPVAARVVPWHTGQMDFPPRCLTDDQKSCRASELHDGPGAERQLRLANPASMHVAQSFCQGSGISLHQKTKLERSQVKSIAIIFRQLPDLINQKNRPTAHKPQSRHLSSPTPLQCSRIFYRYVFRRAMQEGVEASPTGLIPATQRSTGFARQTASCLGLICRHERFKAGQQNIDQRSWRSCLHIRRGRFRCHQPAPIPRCSFASSLIMDGSQGGSYVNSTSTA